MIKFLDMNTREKKVFDSISDLRNYAEKLPDYSKVRSWKLAIRGASYSCVLNCTGKAEKLILFAQIVNNLDNAYNEIKNVDASYDQL